MIRLPLALTAFALVLAAGNAHAQTTHVVTLQGTTFTPSDLTIKVGDTVQWDWVSGLHNVESGVSSIHDGNFRSGDPVMAPMSYSVTFDQGFLLANPMPGDLYPYYCIVHEGLGMTGTVRVCPIAASFFRNDSGNTNLGTYMNVSPPVLGGTWSTTIDVSSHAGAGGAFIIGYGAPFQFPSSFGWILVDFTHPAGQMLQVTGFGGGLINYNVTVPADPTFCGLNVSTQGAIFGGGIELTNAQDIVLGL